jgi:hypothetical protein
MKLFRLKNCNCTNQKFNGSALLVVAFVLTCVAISPMAQAVVPAPDGGYPNANTAEGQDALLNLNTTTGSYNTALGFGSLKNDINGSYNTAVGAGALLSNTASENTATGMAALLSNTSGTINVANGAFALFSNASGSVNTAVGDRALFSNTTGGGNTAVGGFALFSNNASGNTAMGAGALGSNTTGDANTAIGDQALFSNATGSFNTAIGDQALYSNKVGGNTATGFRALQDNTTGLGNTAMGAAALGNNITGGGNTAIGEHALLNNIIAGGNTAIGYLAGMAITGNGNVCIGADVHGDPGVDHTTWIENVNTLTQNFSAGVNDYVTVRLSDGRLGHTAVVSSRRYKENIKPLAAASGALYALQPVSFRLKKEYDEMQALGFGLIAEEVEKVDPSLVYRNTEGQPESVRYEMINAMLLNEFLKEHRKVEQLEKQVEKLTAGLQKVSDEIELGKTAPRMVVNHR